MTREQAMEILLVEAEPTLQAALGTALRSEGFEVRAAGNAEEALSALDSGGVPLVVTELGLPDLSGIELWRRVREKEPSAEVIFLAGSEDARLALAAMRLGAAGYLVKQWDGVEELVAQVRAAQARRSERQRRACFLQDLADLNEGVLRQMAHLEKENEDLQEMLRSMAAPAPEGGPGRVLVADDEQVVLTVVGNLLRDEGYEVELVLSGKEALERLDAQYFDLMVVDKNLPDMSGLELLRKVRQSQPEMESVLITGYGSLESAIEALHLGAGGYLLKPFEDITLVLAKVNELRARQLERRKRAQYLHSFKARNEVLLARFQEIRDRFQEFLNAG
jgi:DNA-binding NtrC family response regulator